MRERYYVCKDKRDDIKEVAKIEEFDHSLFRGYSYSFFPYGLNDKGEWEFRPSLAFIKKGDSRFEEITISEVEKLIEDKRKHNTKNVIDETKKDKPIYYVYYNDYDGTIGNIVKRENHSYYIYEDGNWEVKNYLIKIEFEVTEYEEVSEEEAFKLIEERNKKQKKISNK